MKATALSLGAFDRLRLSGMEMSDLGGFQLVGFG